VVFTSDQDLVVKGVADGDFDIGFVRTGMVERFGWDGFKIIDEDFHVGSDGHPFPFKHSTELYPEWNLAALTHVPAAITAEVQAALLRMDASHPAAKAGLYAGWRTTLSYMELRNMQEEVGFISQNSSTHRVQCIRSSNFYAHIVCPAGHYKLPDAELAASCSRNGLKCDSEFSCVCKPCAQ
ncbi:unnamed protein product, partial [Polarella glacialis]